MSTATRVVGTAVDRLEGEAKVRGRALYATEHPVDDPVFAHLVQSRIARGRITGIDTGAALEEPGVLDVVTHHNAPELASTDDAELAVLQSPDVGYRGQPIAVVLAESSESARAAAGLVRVEYEQAEHDVHLSADRDDLVAADDDREQGDLDAALVRADVVHDAVYTTPQEHHIALEPHATTAVWSEGALTVYDSTQGVHWVRDALTDLFGVDPENVHVVAPHVGGGFGSKGPAHAHLVAAVLAAQRVQPRPVKLVLTRQQSFPIVGPRAATIQRIRLGADAEGHLTAVGNDVVAQSARLKDFTEQAGTPTAMMYAAPNRRITHRLARLDLPVPTWMRAPGECPGMFALETAMDEMAIACGLDPIEFRIRNEPDTDPDSGLPYSSRNLVVCLREGARRFGWADRDPAPGTRRAGEWLVGTGVAASTYPVNSMPGTQATIHAQPDGRYRVLIGATDIGTGAWTALTQIAADALGAELDRVTVSIGDTDLPWASGAGGSTGITCWGSAIVDAARRLREEVPEGQPVPEGGAVVTGATPDNPHSGQWSMHSFGAQFAEVRVHRDTGEVRVPRMLGIFAAGRIVNAKTGASQLLGGMTMGVSMALHEQAHVDPRFGHVINQDMEKYHVASCADIGDVEVDWVDEDDPHVNPMGTKGIGELGIVGAAAAVDNAVHHATGTRVRDLPITPDKLLTG
ncbi:xanthine dehydrogenase family protein molybdopterin-binding subunit [Saccharopolyspora rhizosphaerae]|uniref:Xanthine dehydrogenase family protein molybdopterin-binding subunit n=1 Tax=Saccharopolyspora rhizosphaerae TaxID=2492662 RepID=A0A426K3F3_9PSEU|nr:xanthine dehydrogenase family protein molybdopterin-binding subunit [Saccharopolyspora rhizosphaerae]RRO19904.1 xanthine dehydrogenase family protein molybdopterin-binding subunit [Saccharopolyspora rhizosphaerae]